eukprot:4311013-Prymnesium_polylepis.1
MLRRVSRLKNRRRSASARQHKFSSVYHLCYASCVASQPSMALSCPQLTSVTRSHVGRESHNVLLGTEAMGWLAGVTDDSFESLEDIDCVRLRDTARDGV